MDRLGWAAGEAFELDGVRVGLRVSEPQLLADAQAYLPPGREASGSAEVSHIYSLVGGGGGARPGVRRFNLAYSGGSRIARSHDVRDAFEAMEASMRLFIAMRAQRLYVHSGAVGLARGALLLPGCSGAGKTTLVRSLLGAGASYFSDEYAVLDADARLHPFARDLSVRQDGDHPLRLPPAALGSPAGRGPARVGLVLLTRYRAGARFRPRRLTGGPALLGLLAHAVPARIRPEDTVEGLARLVGRAVVLQGVRGEVEQVSEWLSREGWL